MPLPKKIPRSRSAKTKDSEKRVLANRYRIERKLGSGNFGTAWLATDLKCKDPKEQLKVLKEISVGDLQPDETVDAMHEANLLRNLDHPGIVKFHDSFIEGEFFCIVTEFCEGGDLDVKIQQMKKVNKQFPEALIVEWLIQLMLAVQYMHSRRVLHRDLKTRNIFLRNNVIKVGDFGISRILMGTTDMASTFTGTPYYMSPEVLKHEGYNSKSDVWSVGCMLYELCALSHAFEGQSLMGVMYKIVEGNLPNLPDKYSKELQGVFHKILTKDPANRPSAAEVLKIPYIEQQMEMLKNTMMDKHYAKDNKESMNKEQQLIAIAMKQKSNLGQLKKESEESKWKNMSPRERARLRKQQKADEEAKRMQAAAQQQLVDNTKRYKEIQQTMNAYKSDVPPWLRQKQEREASEKENIDYRPYTAPSPARNAFMDDDDDYDDDDDIIQALPDHYRRKYSEEDSNNALNVPKPFATVACDDRPITPMKNTMVYNRDYSSLDFKDGIPDKPDLAETYYSQFDDEFEDDQDGEELTEEDEEKVRQIIAAVDREVDELYSDDDEDNEGTLLATVMAGSGGNRKKSSKAVGDNEDEVGDLINCMQNALDRSDTIKSQTISDDTIVGAFGPGAREIKVKNLRTECEKKLGKKEFDLAYEYLKKARFGDDKARTMDEAKIMGDLRKLVKNPNDCFMVDQLLFLEEQAKLVQM